MIRRPLLSRSLRRLIASFGLTAATLIGPQQLGAQVFSGFNSNAPVNYSADRIELQNRENRVVLSGAVNVVQGDMRIQSARMVVAYTNTGSMSIQRIDATGGVVVHRGDETARGDVAVYDFNRRIITMAGNVALAQHGNTLNGGRLVVDLATGVSSVDGRAGGGSSALGATGSSGGRVSGTFTVPKHNH